MPDRGATAALLLALGLALCRSPPCRRTCSCTRAPFRCSTAESGSHSYLSALLWFLSCLQFPDISAFGLMCDEKQKAGGTFERNRVHSAQPPLQALTVRPGLVPV